MLRQGDTFLAGREVHGSHHLWVVINDPGQHENKALIVNVSTIREGAETTCILAPGEHPFIKHESYARFRSARVVFVRDIETLARSGMLVAQPVATSDLVAKLRAGAAASSRLPPDCLVVL